MYEKILKFWFEDIDPKKWFMKDETFDRTLIKKFSDLHDEIISNKHTDWENNPDSALALILVLDQFSRNMFRDTPKAFKSDKFALRVAKNSIEKGFDKKVTKGRQFFYMPFMHSEKLEDQEKSILLFTELAKDDNKSEKLITYAIAHYDIIERFGRFPHRNKILNRESTNEEIEFLKTPNSSF